MRRTDMPIYRVSFECEIEIEAKDENEADNEAWSIFEEHLQSTVTLVSEKPLLTGQQN
jgi:hypothetical protein